MKVTAFEGIVENGRIILPDTIHLPEKAKVYVVLPGNDAPPASYVGSPRLAHLEQANDFVKEVTEDAQDASLR